VVRALVDVQLPQDLQKAYTIACVHEEVSDNCSPWTPAPAMTTRRAISWTTPVKPEKLLEEKKPTEVFKQPDTRQTVDDKFSALKSYRRAKGLCFMCGERWWKEHKCQPTVQLHVMQEMINMLHSSPDSGMDVSESGDDMELMHIADVPLDDPTPEQPIVLQCTIQGKLLLFLLDSSSNNSFLCNSIAASLSGQIKMQRPR
jgi:hypothetical protein